MTRCAPLTKVPRPRLRGNSPLPGQPCANFGCPFQPRLPPLRQPSCSQIHLHPCSHHSAHRVPPTGHADKPSKSLHKRFITLTAAIGSGAMSVAEVRDTAWPSACFLPSLAPTRLCSHSQTTHGGYRAPSINGKAHTGTVLLRPHCVQPGTSVCTGGFRTCTYVHAGTD